jgi:hypothetical protein
MKLDPFLSSAEKAGSTGSAGSLRKSKSQSLLCSFINVVFLSEY